VLSKKICIACITSFYVGNWDDDDEKQWKEGHVVACPLGWIEIGEEDPHVNAMPPKDCKYALEHLMDTQKSHPISQE